MTPFIINSVIQLTYQASAAILSIYDGYDDADTMLKEDRSPVTSADLAAQEILQRGLQLLLPDTPVLSEEASIPPYCERQAWERYWLIDPLDGTKEFLHRNGEFTVNVALIERGVPVFGVVTVPLTGICYWGIPGQGAYRKEGEHIESLVARSLAHDCQRIDMVCSRRHGTESMVGLNAVLKQHFEQVNYRSMGSSLKLCLIAEGQADIYPRFAPTSEWDIAAAQAIVVAAGGTVVDLSFKPLRYNDKDCVLNPYFYVLGDASYPWQLLLSTLIHE